MLEWKDAGIIWEAQNNPFQFIVHDSSNFRSINPPQHLFAISQF